MKYAWMQETRIGPITLTASDAALLAADFSENPPADATLAQTPLLAKAFAELDEYLAGKRETFDLPLEPVGTPFQLRVWQALREIPYGKTATYGEIAARVGNAKASRAVGMANNRNPLPIFIPCHRVIGANGTLVGYGGGLPIKTKLLQIEGLLL